MQLFGWSPTTFHSVWNAGNCQMYVLKKDLSKPGPSPYVLDKDRGDVPTSSIKVQVQLKASGETKSLVLKDYLSVPPPRTTQFHCIKYMLAEQYPEEIKDAEDIASIMFMPFVGGGVIKGRSSSEVECKTASTPITTAESPSLVVSSSPLRTNEEVSSTSLSSKSTHETCDDTDRPTTASDVQWAKREQSLRWSYFRVPGERSTIER
jgi:hypothetical protein